MQHHGLPPRPQHIRHPMHQGPMHAGHPPPPPPHMSLNMGPPPPPHQQPHHMPAGPGPRGPIPQQYGIPQMREQNRLGHHQHLQQHQRVNNHMQPNQMQHHKGRPQNVGGGGHQGQPKYGGMQKNGYPQSMRNNNQQHAPQQPRQTTQQGRGRGEQQIKVVKSSAPPSQPQVEKQQQQIVQQINPVQQCQQPHVNSQPIEHLNRPPQPAVPHQQTRRGHFQQQHVQNKGQNQNNRNSHQQQQHQQQPLQTQPSQHIQQPQQPQQHRQQQKFSHPRAILQNPNRINNQQKVSGPPPPMNSLPTVTEVESTVISSAKAAESATSEKLSATAEDFTPKSKEKSPAEEKNEKDNGGPLNTIMSSAKDDDSCFKSAKEKTPMCMVNELARFNKIQHQYRLTSENGPAHCKRFTVTLILGDEEYSAEGYKIKKAQHLAAAEAMKKTKYTRPVPKPLRRPEESLRTLVTPTVELNALAMKLGHQTYYVFDPSSQNETNSSESIPYSVNGPRLSRKVAFVTPSLQQRQEQQYQQRHEQQYQQRQEQQYQQPRYPVGRVYPPKFLPGRIPSVNAMTGIAPHLTNGVLSEIVKITLIVGKQKFLGTGRTLQSAKHDAAAKAVQVLKSQAANKFKEMIAKTAEESDWKSPISLVHELAIKHNLSVSFRVSREDGPAHMKNFITICEVGDLVTEGDGNGKRISKKRAAEKMVEELKKLPPLSPSISPPIKRIKVKNNKRMTSPINLKKKSGGSSIREKTESECAEDANPISRLIQCQQARNEKEPVYELIACSGESKKREFVMEVNIPGKVARGTGSTKKLAKRDAAKNLLLAMGVKLENEGNDENNSQIANQHTTSKVARKVKFIENNNSNQTPDANVAAQNSNGGTSGRQIVPGVILLRQQSKDSEETDNCEGVEPLPPAEPPKTSSPPIKTKSTTPSSEASTSVRPKDQLLYLAQILGFQANFSDYPKGNHNEFLTIVTLSTSPPQICHGVGMNVEESQDQAASAALQILSKLGLDNIKPKSDD